MTTTTDFEAEYEQLGRNTASKCRATFVALVASKTENPRLIAAAERGRREVLSVEGIHVVVATEHTTIARVRADDGIWDVTRGHLTGWGCSCNEVGGRCAHVLAVEQLTRTS